MQTKPIQYHYQTVEEMRGAAGDILPEMVKEYLEAGSGQGHTLKNNLIAYKKWNLIPKRLRGVTHPDLSTSVFGNKYDLPFGAAPVGIQQLFHEQGELATVRACTMHNSTCILSTVSNLSYEEASKSCEVKPWFQLYPTDNLDVTKQLILKAEQAGAEVIVLTVDVPVLGKRKHNAKSLLQQSEYKHLSFGNLKNTLHAEDNIHHAGMNWDLFEYIKEMTKCKLVVKGIIHPSDAKQCIDLGADGIVISNHGGRQLDSCISTLDALVHIKSAVPKDFPLFIDGGIRSAEDILKALLLGANMVFVGRPICYGLAIGGKAGVSHLFDVLKGDLKRTMQLMGIPDLGSLDDSQISKK